jgi:transposase
LTLHGNERWWLVAMAERWYPPDSRRGRRARIVLACADGQDNASVAKRLGVTPGTVGKWRRRFVRHRFGGLLA